MATFALISVRTVNFSPSQQNSIKTKRICVDSFKVKLLNGQKWQSQFGHRFRNKVF